MSVKTVQATVNGQTVSLTYNSSTGRYDGTITALVNPAIINRDIIMG